MESSSFRFDGFELDTVRFELRSGTEPIPVEPRAFDLLSYLVLHRDRVVGKEELLDALWGDRFVGEAALTTALRTARIAVDDNGKDQRLIRTVLRRGYQFVGSVDETRSVAGSQRVRDARLPIRLAEPSGLGFAGRAAERAVLTTACKEVTTTGQCQLIVVSGEAGIGKTALCSQIAAEVHHDGALVLYGRCDEELTVPYQPWRAVLADLERHVPDAIAGRTDALGPLLDGTGAASSETNSDSARFALFSAVADVLDAASTESGLVLVVLDDLHWADVQTVALLRHLTQLSLDSPVLLIATFRDADIDAAHPLSGLLAAAHREPGTTRMPLDRLGDEDLLALLELVAGHEMDEDGVALCVALRSETEGNAFFVTEMLRHLTETGTIEHGDGGRWITPADLVARALPISVREVVGRRVERLGPDTRTALDTASIIGREFDLDLLAELLGEDVASTFGRLAPAVDNALVDDAGGRFEFAHAIVGRTLYEELSPTVRALGHEAVAVELERRSNGGTGGRASEIAHHWMRSIGPESAGKSAEYTQRAGDHALDQLAPEEAVSWYRITLELIPLGDIDRRCTVLVGLGTAQRQAGDTGHRETLIEAGRLAIRLNRHDLLVRAALANNRGEVSQVGTVDHERIELLRAAIDVCPDGSDGAMLHAILGIEEQGGPDGDIQATPSRALELARKSGDDRTMARVVRLAESALRVPDALERREQWVRDGIAAAERTGDPQLRGSLSMSWHELALQRGDRDTMDSEQRIRDAFSTRSPEPFVRWTNEQTRAIHRFLDGDLEGAEAAAQAGLEVGVASGQPEAFLGYAGQLFQIRRAQDRLAEIADDLERVHLENPTLAVFRAALAAVWCELDRKSDARTLVESLEVSAGEAPQFWSTTLMFGADAAHELGLVELAERLLPILERWKAQVTSTGATTEGSIAHGLGRALATLGRTAEAVEAYDLALVVNRGLRAPLFVSRTQLALAQLLAENDPRRARAIAVDAQASATEFGFARVARHCRALSERLE